MSSDGVAGIDADAGDYVDLEDAVDAEGESLPPAEAWEAMEGLTWAYGLAKIRGDVTDALGDLERDVRDGRRPTPEQVRDARLALEAAEQLVEEHYAALAREDP